MSFVNEAIFGKESACNAGDLGSIPRLGISPGEGDGSPFQYSCLENPMDGGTGQKTAHGVAQSQTELSNFTFITFFWEEPKDGGWLLVETTNYLINSVYVIKLP